MCKKDCRKTCICFNFKIITYTEQNKLKTRDHRIALKIYLNIQTYFKSLVTAKSQIFKFIYRESK